MTSNHQGWQLKFGQSHMSMLLPIRIPDKRSASDYEAGLAGIVDALVCQVLDGFRITWKSSCPHVWRQSCYMARLVIQLPCLFLPPSSAVRSSQYQVPLRSVTS